MISRRVTKRLGRFGARAIAGFGAIVALLGAENSPPAREPVVLPKMTVGAGVPLRKVGEHALLEPRFAPAVVAAGNFLYVVGGLRDDNDGLTSIERFDVRTGTTEKFVDLRVARLWHGAALVGEKLFVLGGVAAGRLNTARGSTDLESSVEIVDLATRSVTPGPAMPDARRSFACVVLGQKIVVIGGQRVSRDRTSETNTVLVLDPATRIWSEGPPMATAREAVAAVVDGGFVVVPGGYHQTKGSLDVVEVLDPRAGVWRTLPPLARRMSAHSLVFAGRHLFLFGDYTTPEKLLAYDLKTRTSEVFTLGYRAARHTGAVLHDGKIYVVGGRETKNSAPLALIQVFEPAAAAPGK